MIEQILEVTLVKEFVDDTTPITQDGNANIKQENNIVYANSTSITQSEYYNARNKGFKPELCLKINYFEYNGERFCIVNGIKYEIYRTYQKNNSEFIELFLKSDIC